MCSSSPVRTPKLKPIAEQASKGECWIPPKKDTSHPRAKEKPHQDGRRSKITFRIKPQTSQRCLKGSNKPSYATGPREPTRNRASPAFECLSISCRGSSQQWPTMRTGALAAADLGATVYRISPLGRGHHLPLHTATEQMTHKLENN